jgi:hypothetical protein
MQVPGLRVCSRGAVRGARRSYGPHKPPHRRRSRSRGRIEQLPSGSLRIVVYAGTDPLTGRRHFLRETVLAGPHAAAEAEKAVRRLAAQVDDRRHPTTNASLDQLLDRYLETLDVGDGSRKMYAKYLEKHVRPFVGRQEAGAVDEEVLDSLYAELLRCRIRCTSKRGLVDHRTPRPHECDERCRPHSCNGLSSTTIRHIRATAHDREAEKGDLQPAAHG